MIGSFTAAARLPQTDRDHAALTGDAEGQAAVALLTQLSGSDWQRPTDCTEWDVRALVSHLVGECEDGLRLRTSVRRELAGSAVEVARPQRPIKGTEGTHSPPLSTYSAPGGLPQDPGRAA
jgi:Mycothiol maleylpyruvate isomerase N-terminal domain